MKSNEEIFNDIKNQLSSMELVRADLIPNIDLYMDQVTTFIDKHLFSPDREDGEHIITKTMINNYAKSELIPPPIKKKYSKDHIIMLILIHYLKNFLSIGEINALLGPIKDNYLSGRGDIDLEYIYNEIISEQKSQHTELMDVLDRKFEASTHAFADAPDDKSKLLQMFSFICSLSFDIYMQKYMLELLIDELDKQYNSPASPEKQTKKDKKDKKDRKE